jgi:hypothetical protein
MGTDLEPRTQELPARLDSHEAWRAEIDPAQLNPAWLTATVRPAGNFAREDTGRLRALLDALAACASIVVLDLQAARLRSLRAGQVIEDAAWDIERRGGCLLCINVDAESRACLSAAGSHAILMDRAPRPAVRG